MGVLYNLMTYLHILFVSISMNRSEFSFLLSVPLENFMNGKEIWKMLWNGCKYEDTKQPVVVEYVLKYLYLSLQLFLLPPIPVNLNLQTKETTITPVILRREYQFFTTLWKFTGCLVDFTWIL